MRRPFFLLFPLLIPVSLSIYSVSFPTKVDYQTKQGYQWEQYDSSYFSQFQSVDALIARADQEFATSPHRSVDYFQYVDGLIRKRFYHGYSHYGLQDNPLAYFAGKIFWSHLSAIVLPDDILKHPMAACSQQSIVMMEVLRRKNIPYRMVGFRHHYALEAFIENAWRFFDANMEANYQGKPASVAALKAEHRFDSLYTHIHPKEKFKENTAVLFTGKINEEPAPNAALFHRVCFVLASNYLILPLILLITGLYYFPFFKEELLRLKKD